MDKKVKTVGNFKKETAGKYIKETQELPQDCPIVMIKDRYKVQFSDSMKTLIRCPKDIQGEYIIPDGVTNIKPWAFARCTGLTSITIPNSVTYIGDHAFFDCSGLTSVTIPNSVTRIGECAFEGCSGLTSVVIPNSVTHIESCVFNRCTGLMSIIIPNSVTDIEWSTFEGCTSLTSVTIQDTEYKTHEAKNNKAIAYKGFNANMMCRDFQYEEGKTFYFVGTPELCRQGFHACLNLCDVFNYYAGKIGQNFVIHEVILEGITDEHKGGDSKVVGNAITIGKRIL